MAALAPDPSDRTNALLELLVLRADNQTFTPADPSPPFSASRGSVTANCLLYASLCCSLIAAVKAMLAKEWLQSYSRSGQAGPLEEQAKFRLRKYAAAQEWHLQSLVLFLPNLLLLSVLFFFAGLILLLSPINAAVTAVVIAFFGVGVVLVCTTIAAGAIWPLCPYQTAVSRALRRAAGFTIWCWKKLMKLAEWLITLPTVVRAGGQIAAAGDEYQNRFGSPLGHTITTISSFTTASQASRPSSPSSAESGLTVVSDIGNRTPTGIRRPLLSTPFGFITQRIVAPIGVGTRTLLALLKPDSAKPSKQARTNEQQQQIVNAKAVGWLLEMTSNLEDQLTAAKNICLIDPSACDELLRHPVVWPRLMSLTVEAVQKWKRQQTDQNMLVAEQFGAALYHLLLLCPLDDEKRRQIKHLLPPEIFQSNSIFRRSIAELAQVLCGYDIVTARARETQPSHSMWKALLHRNILNPYEISLREFIDVTPLHTPFDDASISLLGLLVLRQFESNETTDTDVRSDRDLQVLAAQAYTGYVNSPLLTSIPESDYG